MKCKPAVTTNESAIEKAFSKATFPNPCAKCMTIKDNIGISGHCTLEFTIKSLLEDNEIW